MAFTCVGARPIPARESVRLLPAPAPIGGGPGRFIWSTLLGGEQEENGYGVCLAASGAPIVVGQSASPHYPSTPGAYDVIFNGGFFDAVVSKLDPQAQTLLWSTFLGGDGGERGVSLVRDSAGRLVVAGRTSAHDFPTTPGVLEETFQRGLWDCFVAKLAADGSALIWATYLGGGSNEFLRATAIDASDCPIVIGFTYSPDFPVSPDAHTVSHQGGADVFLARVAPGGDQLIYGTFLGGCDADDGWGMTPAGDQDVVVTGATWSPDFPTSSGAYNQSYSGEGDIFLAKLEIGQTLADAPRVTDLLDGFGAFIRDRGEAEIRLRLMHPAEVDLAVYDPGGRLVRHLLTGSRHSAGLHRIAWSGRDGTGHALAQGIYSVRLTTGEGTIRRGKLLLIR